MTTCDSLVEQGSCKRPEKGGSDFAAYWKLPDATSLAALPRQPWAGWIAPQTLLTQVWNTAPFLQTQLPLPESGRLIHLGATPDGFLRILASWINILEPAISRDEQLQDYFALCMACHHATVATFVPTDVDTKIRGIVWRESADPGVLRPMLRLALDARAWAQDGVSRRVTRGVGGHSGEHWSAIAGGLGRLLELHDHASAAEALAAIEAEIDREESIFEAAAVEPGAEIDMLLLAMTLAHNRGDLTQGMGFWRLNAATRPVQEHLQQRGRFARAVRVYQHTGMSAEGHRHYPLRPVKRLRVSAATLLPLPPFLDDWGVIAMRHIAEPQEVMDALIAGCRKIPGQQGYYRALAGMRAANPGAFDRATRLLPNAAQKELRDADMRKRLDVPRASFESMMKKRARAALELL